MTTPSSPSALEACGDETNALQTMVPKRQDDTSDYGSDFTPDEVELLSGLLYGVPESDLPPILPDLRLENIEDNEGPPGARLPLRLSQDDWIRHAPSLRVSKRPLALEIDGDEGAVHKKSMWRVIRFGSTN